MHGRTHKTLGLTLIEMTLVIGTMVLLVGLAVPAVRSLTHSFQSEGAVKSMIDAALSSARAMAMTRQRYVGVRFQKLCTSDDPANPLKGILDAPQYMIFIVAGEPNLIPPQGPPGLSPALGFRALEGLDPIRLPSTVGVMDARSLGSPVIGAQRYEYLADATTFCILFAPSGRLVAKNVRVRNREGVYQPRNDSGSTSVSHDDVFNSPVNICLYHEGTFIQDDYSSNKNWLTSKDAEEFGLGEEPSLTGFAIYDTVMLRELYQPGTRPPVRIEYLRRLNRGGDKFVHVSSYTGHLVLPG
jgi:hypothetical protein